MSVDVLAGSPSMEVKVLKWASVETMPDRSDAPGVWL
jgi:hypothetical protein